MIIGIPRALLYYKYYPFWRAFLEGLDCAVVTSGPTTEELLQRGVKQAIDESCLPVKVFCGHVLDLIAKGVDYLFIPRIESVERGCFVCTKFLGLPDIVRNCIPQLKPEHILSPNIDLNRRPLYLSMFTVGWKLDKNPLQIHAAYRQARGRQRSFEQMLKLTKTPEEVISLIESGQIKKVKSEGELHIALIGHPYNIYDELIGRGIIRKLQRLGVRVLTSEMVPPETARRMAAEASADLYWTYGQEILGASLYFCAQRVDGVIFIISFPCGPDSLIVEYALRKIKPRVPAISLVLDEHRAEAGIITRVESFVDLVRMRRRRFTPPFLKAAHT